MPSKPTTTNGDDRSIPLEYVGQQDPGYHCRAWNAKRQKYCKNRAGAKTDHPGVGRCAFHGGSHPVKHGKFRRYANVLSLRVRELIAEHGDDDNPLDLHPELATARALLQDYLERRAEDANGEALAEGIRLVEKIARIVESIERTKAQNAITPADLNRLMLNMGLVVRQHVTEEIGAKINEGWLALRV